METLKNKNNWCLVGLGFISDRHRKAIEHVGDKVLLTCDNDETKNADFLSFDIMCESEEFKAVDYVAICTPNYLHVPMIKKCLEKGKKVLCEKPLGLNEEEISELPNDGSVFCVLQLRYKLPKEKISPDKVGMRMNFHRDQSYWDGWKGDTSKSGGLLFNLGVHYFDYLIKVLGENYDIQWSVCEKDYATGVIEFGRTIVGFELSINKDKPIQRTFEFDGKEVNLSNHENLSYEDLHKFVYEDFKKGKGVCPADALKAIKLVALLRR